MPLATQDIVFISPLVRTLETAMLWTDEVDCQKIVTPYVSPRMFPLLTNKQTLPCDLMMEKEKILDIFPVFELDDNPPASLWEKGFNTVIDEDIHIIKERYQEYADLPLNANRGGSFKFIQLIMKIESLADIKLNYFDLQVEVNKMMYSTLEYQLKFF
ncbi:hypothetical protein C2I06_08740 [Niallia circulans]|uniref:hypothetical protein n=2 Tax=Bacillaceae TaxID=186817 RepID=UPI000F450E51|nr:hypothetical protein C2I06_08740 [Niallia circulans]